jgi:alpha-L-fucosidase 2
MTVSFSGSGAMNIELTGDPYSEQVLFHHESLIMPWRRPLEAPKAADIFPQVRQMVLDGKYKEAIEFAYQEMEKGPIKMNTWGHFTKPAFRMTLIFRKQHRSGTISAL